MGYLEDTGCGNRQPADSRIAVSVKSPQHIVHMSPAGPGGVSLAGRLSDGSTSDKIMLKYMFTCSLNQPRFKKTAFGVHCPTGPTQTGLYSHRRKLSA